VLQFYPQTDDQIQLITSIARKAGFGGGVVVDYPNSNKAKKVFLCLYVGGNAGMQQVPKGLEGDSQESDADRIKFERRRQREQQRKRNGKRKTVKGKEWILKKKEVRCSISLADPLIPSRLVVVSPAGKGGSTARFQVHSAETQANFLT
jgi:18S rRNA (guanine1575-N7)-methyltransferase